MRLPRREAQETAGFLCHPSYPIGLSTITDLFLRWFKWGKLVLIDSVFQRLSQIETISKHLILAALICT